MTKTITEKYEKLNRKKIVIGISLLFFLIIFSLYSLSIGGYQLSSKQIYDVLIGQGDDTANLIILNIRLPRIIAALIAGISLAVSGAVMQCTLRNPLASPYTIGISHGAMFGAAFAIILFGIGGAESSGRIFINSPYLVTFFAFAGAMLAALVILLLARLRKFTPEAMILAGIAMGSLFSAGTMVIQYFANDLQLASMVYWTFGDLGRPLWTEVGIMAIVMIFSLTFFIYKRWDYNALESGEESAKSLGVETERIRLLSISIAAVLISVNVAFLGIIGFVGLICPHLVRILIGGDYRFLIPVSALFGAILLLVSDTIARTVISPIVLPVGILTSFMGAPLFLYLLIKMYK
ncbi:MAG: iron ABC transporter permease [Atribacterota bacterium]|jgi:iron complex transport system permease protein|nr:iron ABC transporter permease [Atribacterota bacterium]MDD3641810.1 iron ABC transporter permease [Atribacterota bacterium]MDD4289585.1 iron ABC transporter permease [Atribacterota bacterium]MDD4765755.1 iron ABC transporter permease [Atribacterota bacterium]